MEEVAGEGKPQVLKIVPPLLPWVAASFIWYMKNHFIYE